MEALVAEGVYAMYEMHTINFPKSLEDVNSFLSQMDAFYEVCEAIQSIKEELGSAFWEKCHRHTLDTPTFRSIIDKTRSKTRRCLINYEQ